MLCDVECCVGASFLELSLSWWESAGVISLLSQLTACSQLLQPDNIYSKLLLLSHRSVASTTHPHGHSAV